MKRFVDLVFSRHEPVRGVGEHAKSAIGATLGILLVAALGAAIEMPLLTAPLGATAVLVFGYPGAGLAQPVNVMGAYLLATIVGVAAAHFLPAELWVVAPVVGLSLFLMQTLRVTHPPAGAIPIVALSAPQNSILLFTTLLVGCLAMLVLAILFHRLPPSRRYPAPHPSIPVQTPPGPDE